MYELGVKNKIFGAEKLRPLRSYTDFQVDTRNRPTRMPTLGSQEMVIAGYNQGLGEWMFVCESLEDMTELWDSYASGGALTLNWYAGDPVFLIVIPLVETHRDETLNREAIIDGWIISIDLNTKTEPTTWTFKVFREEPGQGRILMQPDNPEDAGIILVMSSPIDQEKEDSLERWILQFSVPTGPKLRPWATFKAVLEKVRDLQR